MHPRLYSPSLSYENWKVLRMLVDPHRQWVEYVDLERVPNTQLHRIVYRARPNTSTDTLDKISLTFDWAPFPQTVQIERGVYGPLERDGVAVTLSLKLLGRWLGRRAQRRRWRTGTTRRADKAAKTAAAATRG